MYLLIYIYFIDFAIFSGASLAQAWFWMRTRDVGAGKIALLPEESRGMYRLVVMGEELDAGLMQPGILSEAFSPQQVVHEIRNYPYPQLHFLALQGLNPSRHTSAVRESYEVRLAPLSSSSWWKHSYCTSSLLPFSCWWVGQMRLWGASGLRVRERKGESE